MREQMLYAAKAFLKYLQAKSPASAHISDRAWRQTLMLAEPTVELINADLDTLRSTGLMYLSGRGCS